MHICLIKAVEEVIRRFLEAHEKTVSWHNFSHTGWSEKREEIRAVSWSHLGNLKVKAEV